MNVLFIVLLPINTASAEVKPVLRMAMPEYPPYTYLQDGQYKGEGYEAFVFIMLHLQREFEVLLVPNYSRAVTDFHNNLIDGLFLASENAERNSMAVFSDPVSYINWTWVWLADNSKLQSDSFRFHEDALVSAQLNSNIYVWLRQQGYQVAGGPNNIRDLFRLLNGRRVDAIMLPEQTAYTVIQENNYPMSDYQFKVERELAFGIYMSKSFLALEPDFMIALNEAIALFRKAQMIKKPEGKN